MSITEQSPFRTAFLKMKITPETMKTHEQIIKTTTALLEHNAGTRHIPEWNAHLKFETYNVLKRNGVMS